jgi:hypothetical protein
MEKRIVLSSNHRDRQGDVMAKEALEDAVVQINGDLKLPWTVEHKRYLPPIGRIVNALIVENGDHILLTAETENFSVREELDWNSALYIERFNEPAPFILDNAPVDKTTVSLDRSNFQSVEEYKAIIQEISQLDDEVKVSSFMRKSLIPYPEIVIKVAEIWGLAHVLKPFADKFGEKIAEKFAEDVYDGGKEQLKKFLNYVLGIVKVTRGRLIPKTRTTVFVFQVPGTPFVELIVDDPDPLLLAKGLSQEELNKVKEVIETFNLRYPVTKIQFILDNSGKWKLTFLLTATGNVIGDKAVFKARDLLVSEVTLP